MTLLTNGHRIIENIYYNESLNEVIFSVVNDPTDIVNIIRTDANGDRTLEFYKRNSETKERIHWAVPAKMGLDGMVKMFEMARTL